MVAAALLDGKPRPVDSNIGALVSGVVFGGLAGVIVGSSAGAAWGVLGGDGVPR